MRNVLDSGLGMGPLANHQERLGCCSSGPRSNDPAIFWPCRTGLMPVQHDYKINPQPTAGSTCDGQLPTVALDEETKRQILTMVQKMDVLSRQVDNALIGIGDLQATVATLPDHASCASGSVSLRSSEGGFEAGEAIYGGGLVDTLASTRTTQMGSKSPGELMENKEVGSPAPESAEDFSGRKVARKGMSKMSSLVQSTQSLDTPDMRDPKPRMSRVSWPSQSLALATLRNRRSGCAEAIWRFLEEPESGRAAMWYAQLWLPFIFATVVVTLLQSARPPPLSGFPAVVVELSFDALFVFEALLRFLACPNMRVFMQSCYNIVDVVAALPLIGRVALGVTDAPDIEGNGLRSQLALILLCLSPVLRLLKTLRRFQQFHLFIAAMSFTSEAMKFLLLMLVLIVVSCSALLYLVEPRSNIETLPLAMWMTVVTMTTVGYGDLTPETPWGYAITTCLLVGSVLFMAMPIGIVGNAFTEVWKDRDRILLNHRFQDQMIQRGYTAEDISMLFKEFDVNKDGQLELPEFLCMLKEMQLGIREERIVQLFESIDKDGSGGIDAKEFVRSFFPHRFHEMYRSLSGINKEVDGRKGSRRPSRRHHDKREMTLKCSPEERSDLSPCAEKSAWRQRTEVLVAGVPRVPSLLGELIERTRGDD
mmetsp:Transcript_259/g.604  ORF Transcript_259/g.604 Transcript_259/m.604 type:complete len:650 (+) Transcript_259:51-2000(+)